MNEESGKTVWAHPTPDGLAEFERVAWDVRYVWVELCDPANPGAIPNCMTLQDTLGRIWSVRLFYTD
jgi:hypothetical protein